MDATAVWNAEEECVVALVNHRFYYIAPYNHEYY